RCVPRRQHQLCDGGEHMNRRGHRADPTKFLAGLMMTGDELRGHVADVLALPLSDSQTTAALLARAPFTEENQLLTAALAVAREQVNGRLAELKRDLADSEEEREQLETELRDLRDGLKNLLGEEHT